MSARAILLGVSKRWPFAACKNENKNKTPSNPTHSGSYIESRLQKSAQDDKWSFCLTAGTLCPTNQERQ
jgi:hypothetical protein